MSSAPSDNEIRRIFDLFDEEKCGKVRTANLPMLIRAFEQNPTQVEISSYKNEVDPNGTGCLDYADFSRTLLRRWRDPSTEEEAFIRSFKLLDKHKSGFIKLSDMCNILKNTGDGFSMGELNDFVELCKASGLTSGDNVDYREVSRLLAEGLNKQELREAEEPADESEKQIQVDSERKP